MINISNEDKALWLADSTHKSLTISIPNLNLTLTNSDIVSESLKITERLEPKEDLLFRGCNATCLKFESEALTADIRGQKIIVSISADGATESITLFTGYVEEVTNPSNEDITTKVTAYDALYKMNNTDVAEWYEALEFPMTLKAFRDSLFEYLEEEQTEATLEFDDLSVTKTIDAESISGLTVMEAICELNAVYGRIGRDGKFEYITLGTIDEPLLPADDLYPSDTLYPYNGNSDYEVTPSKCKSISYENFECEPITKVQIRQEEDDIGAIYGDGDNAFVIEGNFLTYNLDTATVTDMAERIYNRVSGLAYKPFEVECVGTPWIECGDIVQINTAKNVVCSYVLQRTLSGIQALNDTFEADGEQYRDTQVNSVNNSIQQLYGRTNKLTRNLDETVLELKQNYYDKDDVDAYLKLKLDTDDDDTVVSLMEGYADKISFSAKEMEFQSNSVAISSDKFTLSTDGSISAIAGNIAGLTIAAKKLSYAIDGTTYFEISVPADTVSEILSVGCDADTAKTYRATKIYYNGSITTPSITASSINGNAISGATISSSGGITVTGGGISVTDAIGISTLTGDIKSTSGDIATSSGDISTSTGDISTAFGDIISTNGTVTGKYVKATTAFYYGTSAYSPKSLTWTYSSAVGGYVLASYSNRPTSVLGV